MILQHNINPLLLNITIIVAVKQQFEVTISDIPTPPQIGLRVLVITVSLFILIVQAYMMASRYNSIKENYVFTLLKPVLLVKKLRFRRSKLYRRESILLLHKWHFIACKDLFNFLNVFELLLFRPKEITNFYR